MYSSPPPVPPQQPFSSPPQQERRAEPLSNPLRATRSAMAASQSVMIVDDDNALLTVGRAILSTMKLDIILAHSGEEALALLESSKCNPDLILLDLAMPGGLSGLETFDQLQLLRPEKPVIACSGFFGDGAEDMCRHVGFAGMLPKPYTAESLVSVVRRILHSHAD